MPLHRPRLVKPGLATSLALAACALASAALMGGCELTPRFVTRNDIDVAMNSEGYKTLCRGLEMADADVRRYAVERFLEVQDPVATSCVCGHLQYKGEWDRAVASALDGSSREDMAECFAKQVDDMNLAQREELVIAIHKTKTKVAKAKLLALAAERGVSPGIRSRAISTMTDTTDIETVNTLLGLLRDDHIPEVRAAAAAALAHQRTPEVLAAIEKTASSDTDGTVRATALATAKRVELPNAAPMICKAMMEDPSPIVRKMAVGLFQGAKKDVNVACLVKRATTREDSPEVREEILRVLKTSPNKAVTNALCDAIPFWIESYIIDDHPEKLPGTDIIRAQNDRDWERSLECVQKAYAKRGAYSCYGKQYVGRWMMELGVKGVVAPPCPKDIASGAAKPPAPRTAPAPSGGEGNILSFE